MQASRRVNSTFGAMKTSISAFALAALSAGPCSATTPRTAWLIYPGVPESPAIDGSSKMPSDNVTWRLKSRQGKVSVEKTQPRVPTGYAINFGQCKVDGEIRDDLLAFVRHAPGRQWSTQLSSLWIADPARRSFRVAKTEGVTCLNEGYGV